MGEKYITLRLFKYRDVEPQMDWDVHDTLKEAQESVMETHKHHQGSSFQLSTYMIFKAEVVENG